ncbi:MAG: GC-type dockerin domain-anchored protein, partial [Planctomycetota bacterium]
QLEQTLQPDTVGDDFFDTFGNSMDFRDGLVLVGRNGQDAIATNSGAAYLFDAATGVLLNTYTQQLPAPNPLNAGFGAQVALSGGNAAIAANGENSLTFVDTATGAQIGRLLGGQTQPRIAFGAIFQGSSELADQGGALKAAAIDGTDAVFIEFDPATGAAVTNTVVGVNPVAAVGFGRAFAISGDLAVVGAGGFADSSGNPPTAAYAFDLSTNTLLHEWLPMPKTDQFFGYRVAIDGERAVITSRNADDEAFVYDVITGERIAELGSTTPFERIWDAAIEGNTAYLGVNDVGLSGSGRVLVYDLSALSDCPADTNGDGQLDPSDFNAWVIAFNSSTPECDQNADGLCNPADFNAWVANFNAGCD